MKNLPLWAAAVLLPAAAVLAADQPSRSRSVSGAEGVGRLVAGRGAGEPVPCGVMDPRAVIRDWPRPSRKVAELVLEEYGQPDDCSEKALLWRDRFPWKRMIVHRQPWGRKLFGGRSDVLEQVVKYGVPQAKFADLAAFDPRVTANRARGELAARSDSEKWNFLALNLAEEVIIGWKTPQEARADYRRIRRLTEAGKQSAYTQGLRF